MDHFDKRKFNGKLIGDEPNQLLERYEYIIQKWRAKRYEDGEGDFCLRLPESASNRHVNPARSRYGHSQYLTCGSVAYGVATQTLRSKFDNHALVHICGNPKKTKNKSVSRCINGCHITLATIQYNNSTETCFGYIRDFVDNNRCRKAMKTMGKLTVASINGQIKTNHPHTHNPCFIIYCVPK